MYLIRMEYKYTAPLNIEKFLVCFVGMVTYIFILVLQNHSKLQGYQ